MPEPPIDDSDLYWPGAPPPRGIRALARRVDSDPRLLAIARAMRRRMPGDESYGDPLSTAGHEPVDVVARTASVFQPKRPSVAGEVGLSALQLWQSLSEAQGRGAGDHPVALLFTDLVGFSSWALDAGDEAALTLLRAVGVAIESEIRGRSGTIVKRLGDGLMAAFDTAQDAVMAALDAQDAIAEVEVDGYRPKMRAGVHYGTPRHLGGDYLGVDVNIAARVGSAARGGQILVSEPAIAEIDTTGLHLGRSRALRASGAPKGLRVRTVARE